MNNQSALVLLDIPINFEDFFVKNTYT